MAVCFQRIFKKVKWEKAWETDVFYNTSDKNLSHKPKCSHGDWILALAFQLPFLCPSLTSSSMTQVLPLFVLPPAHHLQSNTAPTLSSGSTLFTIQKAQDHSESSTLLQTSCRAVEYCLTLCLAFPCSIRVLRTLQNQMLLNLDFLPTGRFCLRHNLLYLPPSLSWFHLLL